MKVIKQMNFRGQVGYDVFDDELLIKKTIIVRISKKYKNKIYLFLIDNNGKVIDEVFKFINIYCDYMDVNRKSQILNALKLLYSFLDIFSKDIKNLDKRDIRELSDFILGTSIDGYESEGRSISSFNLYMDNIRFFFRYLGIENEFLFEQRTVVSIKSGYGVLAHTKNYSINKYTTNKSKSNFNHETVPKYIKFDEYKNIIKMIVSDNNKNSLRNRIIVELMFTTGLRIGEVLGLTLEDLVECTNNKEYGTLYIRNRTSDKIYQHAKGKLKVKDKIEYKKKIYNTLGVGYDLVNIGPNLYKLIKEYIDESRSILNISDKVYENINKYSKADSILENINNQYIFLNKNGMPLSVNGWNKFLKSIFNRLNIVVDKGSKKNNLSHRFRHGYAMYLINNENRSIEYVKEKMRHASVQSTMIYYNPTEEEKLKDTKNIEDAIRIKIGIESNE